MKEKQDVILLTMPGLVEREIDRLGVILSDALKDTGYECVLFNHKIESIPKKELLRVLDTFRHEEEQEK